MIPETLPKVKFINIYITEISLVLTSKISRATKYFCESVSFCTSVTQTFAVSFGAEKKIESSNPEKFLKVTFVFLEGFKVLDNSVTDGQEVSNVLSRHPVV